ncbi:hypothetical protein IMZ48_16280 [Candidatus Bathyarchaeota archaeon]|nr:hypothetical protein [Candidatus Bathyarchaeota archaeon]
MYFGLHPDSVHRPTHDTWLGVRGTRTAEALAAAAVTLHPGIICTGARGNDNEVMEEGVYCAMQQVLDNIGAKGRVLCR